MLADAGAGEALGNRRGVFALDQLAEQQIALGVGDLIAHAQGMSLAGLPPSRKRLRQHGEAVADGDNTAGILVCLVDFALLA